MTQSLRTLKEFGVWQRKRQETEQIQRLTEPGTQHVLSRCRIKGSVVRAIRASTGCCETQSVREGQLTMAPRQADDWTFTKPASPLQAQRAQGFCVITWHTDSGIFKFQVFSLIDTVHSDIYSPVYFFFQLMPARMKLTSDPSCPKISKIPGNKWISLDKTKSWLTFCTLAKSTKFIMHFFIAKTQHSLASFSLETKEIT